jgi:hypothetical protein
MGKGQQVMNGLKNEAHIHNRVLFSHTEEWNYVICKKMDGTGDLHIEWDEPSSERQRPHIFAHMRNPDLKKMTCL